eukprot:3793969-Prymnesium_polylepis.1
MFTTAHGEPWRTSHTRQLAQRIVRLAGLDEREVGAKAFRIGGSTDCKELTGEAGKALIKRRGRWTSDVAEIYQRELASAQLALSASATPRASASRRCAPGGRRPRAEAPGQPLRPALRGGPGPERQHSFLGCVADEASG